MMVWVNFLKLFPNYSNLLPWNWTLESNELINIERNMDIVFYVDVARFSLSDFIWFHYFIGIYLYLYLLAGNWLQMMVWVNLVKLFQNYSNLRHSIWIAISTVIN